ncbi:MAG: prolipoprotein diacylglyceryl transferase [Candidatus Zixiibacteriota bacterium]|nr:MAG: prolipoprotein diacylglyceryl transferase [candidate division Zixibacteria bacterium]
MCPDLFQIGPLPIRAYGLALAVSFFLGVLYVWRQTSKRGLSFDPYLSISYIMIAAGVIGARLFYVFSHVDEFSGNWPSSFNPFGGSRFGIAGLNVYGGVIAAVLATYIYCRVKKMSLLEVLDFFAPTLGLGLAITRIGCFMNGCCFGTPTELPWGVSFPVASIPHYVFGDAHLHPSQLYSSLYGLLVFLLLHFMLKHRRFAGQILATLFMVEAVFRYAIEYVRYYEDEMHFSLLGMNPTYNQIISIALFCLGLGIYLTQGRKRRTTVDEDN